MAKCNACGRIMFGGVRADGLRYCSNRCRNSHRLISDAQLIPAEVTDALAAQIHAGRCPKCKGPGPVDVHKYYQVWSALVVTRWSTRSQVSCLRCAIKSQAGSLLFSLLFGWWGIPWGIVFTPVQIFRNAAEMIFPQDRALPSERLKRLASVQLASRVVPAAPRSRVPPHQTAV